MKQILQIVQMACGMLFLHGSIAGQIMISGQNSLGGSQDEESGSASLYPAADGNYWLGMLSASPVSGNKTDGLYGVTDAWITKITPDGTLLWQKTYGGTESDYSISVLEHAGAAYFGISSVSAVSGNKTVPRYGNSLATYSDFWIVKATPDGDEIWQKLYGTVMPDILKQMMALPNGNILLGGTSIGGISIDKSEASRGVNDIWCLVIDTAGNKIWDKTIGANNNEYLEFMAFCSDGIILGAKTQSGISGDKQTPYYGGGSDAWIIKLGFDGSLLWEQTLGGTNHDLLISLSVADDRIYCVGTSLSAPGGNLDIENKGALDGWIAELDVNNGAVIRTKSFGGSSFDYFSYVEKLYDDRVLIMGTSKSGIDGDKTLPSIGEEDIWILLLNEQWEIIEQYVIGGTDTDFAINTCKNNDGSHTLVANGRSPVGADKTTPAYGGKDTWVMRLQHSLGNGEMSGPVVMLYPNPATDVCNMVLPANAVYEKLRIVNASGQTVYETSLNQAEGSTYTLNTASWAPGAYFIDLQNKKGLSLRSTLLKK